MKTLTDELRTWRQANGLSLSQAAARCSLGSLQHYDQIERGEHLQLYGRTLLKLADGTGIDIETLARAAELQRAVTA